MFWLNSTLAFKQNSGFEITEIYVNFDFFFINLQTFIECKKCYAAQYFLVLIHLKIN